MLRHASYTDLQLPVSSTYSCSQGILSYQVTQEAVRFHLSTTLSHSNFTTQLHSDTLTHVPGDDFVDSVPAFRDSGRGWDTARRSLVGELGPEKRVEYSFARALLN